MRYLPWSVVCLTLIGCGQAENKAKTEAKSRAYLLTAAPEGAKGVLEIKNSAADGNDVVVIGRVGGSERPLVPGRASFTIVDTSFKSCSDREGDSCPTPWDYCCEPTEELQKGTLLVRIVDESGNVVAQPADQLLGLQPLQTVIIAGKVRRGEGSFVLLAKGVHIKS